MPAVPEPMRLVEPDGTVAAGAEETLIGLGLDRDDLLDLLRCLAVTRGLDDELMALQRQGELALYPPCRGQEGVQVGTAAALGVDDWMVTQYRDLGAYVWRGLDPASVAMLWRGVTHGPPGMAALRMTPIAIPIGTQALHAVGSAMASTLRGDGLVTLTYCGDGATSEGDVSEALNMAGVFRAPVVFVVQNNQWAISTPLASQTASPSLAHRAIGFGIPGIRVDGNDVLACLHVTRQAVSRARDGQGPTLVEAITYRMGPHTTADDPTRYRDADDDAPWLARDPLTRFEALLRERGILHEAVEESVAAEVAERRAALRRSVVGRADPSLESAFEHVTGFDDPYLLTQRECLADEWARADGGDR